MNGLRIGSLFSGIGGLELGLERAGVGRTVWQCEINPWARQVLAKHWPSVPCHEDVRTFEPEEGSADLIAGGFPCQDISQAGKGAGIQEGTRSGLWSQFVRIVGKVRPRFVIVENVAILRKRGLGRVLGDLAALGYDAEWDCIPAASVGAPHLRDRLFIVAYPNGGGHVHRESQIFPADTRKSAQRKPVASRSLVSYADGIGQLQQEGREPNVWRRFGYGGGWEPEPNVVRVVHGVPSGVDRIAGLGNSVVPRVGQFIGRRLMDAFSIPCCNLENPQ